MVLQKDPRTGLRILDQIPDEFPALWGQSDKVIHWVGRVLLRWKDGKKQGLQKEPQVLMISDVGLYTFNDDSDLVEYFYTVEAIKEVVGSGKGDLLIIPHAGGTPSALLRVDAPDAPRQAEVIVDILSAIYTFRARGRLQVTWDQFHSESEVLRGRDLLSPHIAKTGGAIKVRNPIDKAELELRYSNGAGGDADADAARRSSRRSKDPAGTGASELEEKLRRTERQLAHCKATMRQHIGEHESELDRIKQQFHELTSYLNRVYEAFPNVRVSLGAPPSFGGGFAAHSGPNHDLAEENRRLRARLEEVERERVHAPAHHAASGAASGMGCSPRHQGHVVASHGYPPAPKAAVNGRAAAAETRRHYRPAAVGSRVVGDIGVDF